MKQARCEASEAPPEAGEEARARVLVVDDERGVREALARLLRDEHAVETADSAAAALDRLRAGAHFDVIVSDVMMPDASGLDLHVALAREFPSFAGRVVFLTGGLAETARERLASLPNVCLGKPMDLGELRDVIRHTAALDRRGFEDGVVEGIGG